MKISGHIYKMDFKNDVEALRILLSVQAWLYMNDDVFSALSSVSLP